MELDQKAGALVQQTQTVRQRSKSKLYLKLFRPFLPLPLITIFYVIINKLFYFDFIVNSWIRLDYVSNSIFNDEWMNKIIYLVCLSLWWLLILPMRLVHFCFLKLVLCWIKFHALLAFNQWSFLFLFSNLLCSSALLFHIQVAFFHVFDSS